MCGREVAKNLFLGKRETGGIRDEISNTSNGKKVQVIKYSVYIPKVQTILEKLPCLAGSSLLDNHENTRQLPAYCLSKKTILSLHFQLFGSLYTFPTPLPCFAS